MNAERARLTQQALDQYATLTLLAADPTDDHAASEPGIVDALSTEELQVLAAALTILAAAARRHAPSPDDPAP
jgi:hypothetical protein